MAAARCFKCNSPLDGDFGMITCVQCGEINFLDESPSESASAPTPTPQTASESEEGIEMPPDTPGGEPVVGGWEPPFSTPQDNIPTPLENQPPAEVAAPEVFSISASEELTKPPSPSGPATPEQAIQEIADFGNQPASSTASGLLHYDVHISRIDTLELRQALLEILKDARFKWNKEDLDRKIHNGVLTLYKLSPIKASVLVKKIRHLDVQVHWSQGNIYETPAQ